MVSPVRITPVEDVPEGASICHYDELPGPAKERLPALVDSSRTTTTDPAFERTVERCDLVKFTDYYSIERV